MQPTSRRAGFTLVELLVVIGIIAVLISLLLPAMNRARDSATTLACSTNLRQLHVATMMYYNDFKRFPLQGTSSTNSSPVYVWKAELLWRNLLAPYLYKGAGFKSGANVFACSTMSSGDSSFHYNYSLGEVGTNSSGLVYNGYTMNGRKGSGLAGGVASLNNKTKEQMDRMVLYFDGNTGRPGSHPWTVLLGGSWSLVPTGSNTERRGVDRRHMRYQAANFVTVAGHLATVKFADNTDEGAFKNFDWKSRNLGWQYSK